MKKWIIGFCVLMCLAIGSIYIFIPSNIVISNVRHIKAFQTTIAKFLTDKEKISACFLKIATKNDTSYTYKGFNYSVSKILYNANEITITSDNVNQISNLIPLELTNDSSSLTWFTEIKTGNNPVTRLKDYLQAVKLKKSMSGIIDHMKLFLEDQKNMYSITVEEIKLTDSVLISTKKISSTSPGISEIYNEIKKLESYASSQNARATNSPMLNVTQIDSGHYEFMVGLPINKLVIETDEIRIKRMPYNGNMLVTEITGGIKSIQNGLKMLDIYKQDAKKTSPAIHYELLITNRQQEPDTAKWITRLYYPVM